MSTESPFSLTIKVGANNDLLTGRADTLEEFLARIDDLRTAQEYLAATGTVHQAVQNLQAGGLIAPSPAPAPSGGIAEQTDKFGNRYVKGDPSVPSCVHGQRVVAHKTSKAGKPYTAYVCVNDSPFGDWKNGKCDQVYPER